MDILIGLVVVAILLTAGYIGYHASQEADTVIKDHSVPVQPDMAEYMPAVHALKHVAVPAGR